MAAQALVIGAGIAGLAAAAALAGRGWEVEVLERSPDLRASGGGIGITPNGLHALATVGAVERVRARSVVQREGGVRLPTGSWLARQDLAFVERRFGAPIRALPRTDLIRSLVETLPDGTVRYGARVELISPGGPDRALLSVDGRERPADLVVAADGIRSATRRSLNPDHPGLQDCGATSWRAVVAADGLDAVAAETWGVGARLSILPLPAGRVHFSALVRCPPPGPGTDRSAPLEATFGRWHDPIGVMLRRAQHGVLFEDRIEELAGRLPRFAHGRTVLVGDAAHPMTPNVGSANLALEDAVELAHVLGPDAAWAAVRAGGARYDAARRPRISGLRRSSRWMGRVAEMRAMPAVLVRNAAVRAGGLLPAAVSARSMDAMVGWRPPAYRG